MEDLIKLTPIAKSLQKGLGLPIEEFLIKYDRYGNERYTLKGVLEFFGCEGIKVNYHQDNDNKKRISVSLPNGRTESFAGVTWGHIVRKVKNELVEAEYAF